jgi:chorismate dehydratase
MLTFLCRFAVKITPKPLDRKIRVGAVNYLNTLPLLYGIERSPVRSRIDLHTGFPAEIARGLLKDELDIGLVPVAILRQMPEYHIVSDYGIAARGPVASVCLFSDVPLSEVDTVLLDYQSRTSVALARILLQQYFKVSPVFEDTEGDAYLHRISGRTAGVVIGDRALEQRRHAKHIVDLAEAWHAWTGHGFVFAAWVSKYSLPEDFRLAFNAANGAGLESLAEVVRAHPFPAYDLHTYYTKNILYRLDMDALEGMRLFLSMLT